MLRGKCECGAVRFELEDAFEYAAHCHCSNCRAQTGSAFKTFGGARRAALRVTEGADNLLVWGEEDGNLTRCATCGSPLYAVVRAGEWVHVGYGTLVDEPTLKPQKHMFVSSKAPWHEIADDLPQSDGY